MDERGVGGSALAATLSRAMEEETLPIARRVLATIVVASLVVAVVAALDASLPMSLIAATNAGLASLLLAFQRRIGPRRAVLVGALVLLAAVLASMAVGKGLHDTAIVVLPIPIFAGNLVLSRRQYALVAGAAVLGAVAIGVLQRAGWVAQRAPLDALDFATPPIVLSAAALFNAFLIDAFRRSVGRAVRRDRDYHEIFNATHEAIFLLDPASHRITDANASASRMFGYSAHELRGATTAALSAEQAGFGQDAADAMIARAAAEGPLVVEWLARRKDGQEFWIEVTLSQTEIGEQPLLLAVARDVGERKRSEHQQRQSEKLQAVGLLAGSVAHDFNNQLTGLIGYAELLRRKAHDPLAVQRYAERILTVSSRARASTARLLTFTRRMPQAVDRVDVHALIREVADLLQRSVGPHVQLTCALASRQATTLGDATQLQSALLNLGLNARDAMPQGGQIAFSTRDIEVPEGSSEVRPGLAGLRPGSYLEVEVADSGHGMDAATRARAFEPFFTTRQTGTGLGLSAVAAAVQAHGGSIAVESTPGRGSVFRLVLPRILSSDDAPGDATPADATLPGLRVLVAEDDPVALDATCEMLESLGCRVTCVADGRAAVERYSTDPAAFDAVVFDLLMPRLGGVEAMEEILRLRPDAVAVIMSGFDPQANVEQALGGRASFLRKPFCSADLAAALSRATPQGR